MKPLLLLTLCALLPPSARAQDLNGSAADAASQSIDSLKKKWGNGAQAAEFAAGSAGAQASPREALSDWAHDCPDIAAYLASKTSSQKKGLGVSTGYASGPALLSYVRPSWYYTWRAVPIAGAEGEFVPLLQYPRRPEDVETLMKDLGAIPAGTRNFLGFNEPDIGPKLGENSPRGAGGAEGQAALPSPAQAEAKRDSLMPFIPSAVARGLKLGSPALANPVLNGETNPWLQTYMKDSDANAASDPDGRTDFIAVHLYSSIAIPDGASPQEAYALVQRSVKGFTDRLKTLEAAYRGKPLWITEMGLEDGAAKDTKRPRYAPKDDACFMAQVLSVLDNDDKVARYAWFSADPQARSPLYPTVPGALFSNGRPTPLADLYR